MGDQIEYENTEEENGLPVKKKAPGSKHSGNIILSKNIELLGSNKVDDFRANRSNKIRAMYHCAVAEVIRCQIE